MSVCEEIIDKLCNNVDIWWRRFMYELRRLNYHSFDNAIENATNWLIGYLKHMNMQVDNKCREKLKNSIMFRIINEIEKRLKILHVKNVATTTSIPIDLGISDKRLKNVIKQGIKQTLVNILNEIDKEFKGD